MKKLVATAAAAAMLGSAAFADVSLGAWGRAVAGIGNQVNDDADGTSNVISNTQSWGGNGPRFGITFSGDHDGVVGFSAQAFLNGSDGWSVGDVATVWYSPIEQLKIWLGKDNAGNPLRGDAIYGTWDMYRVGTMAGDYHEGWTFQGQASTGAAIGIFPIEGLSFYASLNYPYRSALLSSDSADSDKTVVYEDSLNYYYTDGTSSAKNTKAKGKDANIGNVLGRNWSKYSLAYDIEGVGTIKAGVECQGLVKNKKGEYKDNQNVVNVAFDLKAMEETFFFSVGAFIPTVQKYAIHSIENDDSTGYIEESVGNRVNAYARITPMEGLNIHVQGGVKIGTWKTGNADDDDGGYKKDGQLGFLVAGGVDYKLMEDLTLYADVGFANGIYMKNSDADNTDCLNFGVGVTKDYGEGCSVSAGFVGATNNYGMYQTAYMDGTDATYPFSWGIPLVITYSF